MLLTLVVLVISGCIAFYLAEREHDIAIFLALMFALPVVILLVIGVILAGGPFMGAG